MEDIQVITPSRKGSMGVIELNQQLQAVLNPKSVDKPECRSILYTFREGDKVMQIKNNYDIIWHKDGENGTGISTGTSGISVRSTGKVRKSLQNLTADVPPIP